MFEVQEFKGMYTSYQVQSQIHQERRELENVCISLDKKCMK
jgi:hypothetical protein